MKIAVISTTIMKLPPAGYSGLEMLAFQHAEGLAKLGHKVLLVAPIGSKVPEGCELHGTTLGEGEQQAYSGYWQRLPECEAVIDHSWNKWSYILKAEGKLKAPVLGVMHAPAETMFMSPPPVPKPCLVAISKDQSGAIAGHLGVFSRVAYNGIDLNFYKPASDQKKNDRYLFLGRMSKLKGPHIAASVARHCGVNIDLVGDDTLVESPDYVAAVKALATGSQVVYHGGKSRAECVTFFAGAKAMLHCNAVFREPFGLSPVESQACGTPVIAWDHGAMRETINPGKTGFLVRTMDEMEDLIRTDAVSSLSPKACRAWAEQFSVENMVKRYEALCKEAVETGGW
jgi:glycosyltransferase involved in cell wall biosynthesis